MIRFKKFLLLLLVFSFPLAASAQKVVFEANAPETVAAGAVFRVDFVANTEPDTFMAPTFEGVDIILSAPSAAVSKSTLIINGKTEYSEKHTYTYLLRCDKEGTFTIPTAAIEVGGDTYHSKPVKVRIINQSVVAINPGDIVSPPDKGILSEYRPAKRKAFSYRGFSGGMMLHTGYVSAGTITLQGAEEATNSQDMSGMPTGIGGALRLHFGEYLRVGTEGYSTSLKYGPHNSSLNIGWGGILADGIYRMGRWAPFAGVTFGGGSVKNLTITAPTPDDFDTEYNVSYRRYSFLTVTPFVGVEFAATDHVRLMLKADWLTNVSNPQPDFPAGPRVYFGFSFYRVNDAD